MNKTETVFILDRSGSMSGLESDTIGGYNAVLNQQRQAEGQVNVTTVLFDDRYEVLHDRKDIREVEDLTRNDYYVRGCTALIDAIGITLNHFISRVDRDTRVLFVITTDGYENASKEYNADQVRKMISQQKEKGWEFIFMGANIDAVKTGSQLGIDRNENYRHDSQGVDMAYKSLGRAVRSFVTSRCIDEDWNREVKEDYESRK